MPLPCEHPAQTIEQIPRAIDLLRHMDELHPKVLEEHGIEPAAYHRGLVFRSAVESIRGSYAASSTLGRQRMVGEVLDQLKQRGDIQDVQFLGQTRRHDFTVIMEPNRGRMAAIEVKGGEGNSINISTRPIWADEFLVWCHLDGAVVNQPSHGAGAIVFGRLSAEVVLRGKRVDALLIKDVLCGTPARPCPKYRQSTEMGLNTAPDVFLFPRRIPSLDDPEPPPHDMTTLKLPFQILSLYGVQPAEYDKHVWQVRIRVFTDKTGKKKRETTVYRLGKLLDKRVAAGE